MPQVVSSVKALLRKDNKFLLLKETLRKGEIWDLPGGKIEYGESPEQALHREVKEELDLEIQIGESVGVWYFFSLNSHSQVICHTFLCEVIGDAIIDTTKNPSTECFSELKWMTLSEILTDKKIVLSESLKNLLVNFSSKCTD